MTPWFRVAEAMHAEAQRRSGVTYRSVRLERGVGTHHCVCPRRACFSLILIKSLLLRFAKGYGTIAAIK
jgi:hypothetical protein